MRSLQNRHLVDRTDIAFDKKYFRQLHHRSKKYFPIDLSPVSYGEVLSGYTGAKKRTYYKAMLELTANGLQPKHSVVHMFVKPDRYPEDDCKEKDPRAIQYRRPEFNLALMRYIKSYEHALYPNLTMGVVSNTRVIAKGLNQVQRAELFLEKVKHFNNPVFLSCDHSRFDSTINLEHLKCTHDNYQRAFRSKTLQQILNKQKKNRCFSKNGIQYVTTATRMSGDGDTGCGNTEVNAKAIWGLVCHLFKYDFFLDGDDSVVIIEREDLERLDFNHFERCGFKTKIQVETNIHKVDFCQSRLVIGAKPVMVRNPRRAISHANTIRVRYPKSAYPRLLSAIGECELACNPGIPIMQEFGRQLANYERRKLYTPEINWKMGSMKPKIYPITDQARITMWEAWGIDITVQKAFEQLNFTSNAYFEFAHTSEPDFLRKLMKSKRLPTNFNVLANESIWRTRQVVESMDASSSSSWWCDSP